MTGPVRACPVCPKCGGKKFARVDRDDAPRLSVREDGKHDVTYSHGGGSGGRAVPDAGGSADASRGPDGTHSVEHRMMPLRCRNCGSVSGF